MRILIIADNARYTESTVAALTSEGFQVSVSASGEESIELARYSEFDAIAVDASPSDSPGQHVVSRFRAVNVPTPILMLLYENTVSARVTALATGADDCLSKPFHNAELCARLRALVRRSRSHCHPTIRIGTLEVDTESREVRASGRPIHLTSTEYRMFELLALRKGRTVHRETMFENLYDGHQYRHQKILNVFMCKIRKKLATATCGQNYISTTWGDGYKLQEPRLSAA